MYDQELAKFLSKGPRVKEERNKYYTDAFTKIDMLQKQIINYKQQFPHDDELRWYQSKLYYHRATVAMYEALEMDNARKFDEMIALADDALRHQEQPAYRLMKVFGYRELGRREDALKELDYLLENYADEEAVYLKARKMKDEIEASPETACFIATAAYEPTETAKVDILRAYRDQVLLESNLGRRFVSFYYATSPSFARIIAESHLLKSVVRTLLNPVVKAVSISARKRRQNSDG
jgi:tetratricopeptide (TPR) repeat protein